MGEFNSEDHYIYYCGQESFRRNGVAIIVNKSLKCSTLLSNMLSSLIITFLPRSKRLLISWLHSPSAVILEPKKMKSVTVYIFSPSVFQDVMGPDAMIFVF